MKYSPLKYVLHEMKYIFGMYFTIELPKNNAHSLKSLVIPNVGV